MINEIAESDLAELLELNQAHVTELSHLTFDRLRQLVNQAFYAGRPSGCMAFLLAFDQDADYDSPNFLWFRENYERFVYVDRIVISPAERGKGLARDLYEDLFKLARSANFSRIGCEVNSDPPNPGSDRFHEAMGFEVVGEARLEERGKSVRYLLKNL